MRLSGCVAITVVAGALLLPASARASESIPVMPQWLAAKLASDGENCVGVYGFEAWKDYDGPCKLGAYVPPMQAGASIFDREKLDKGLTDAKVPLGLRIITLNELKNFGSTTRREADKRRIRRQARRGKHSQGARMAVSCAAIGALAAGAGILGQAVAKQEFDVRDAAKDFITGCVVAVATPKVLRWVREKGFQYKG
jgi:hypothetical protein